MTLRPPDPDRDAQDYFEINLDPEMHTWTGNRVLASPAEARAELARYAALGQASNWMIVDNPSGRVVGRFFLDLEDRAGVRVVSEGNRIARRCWPRGRNRAARERDTEQWNERHGQTLRIRHYAMTAAQWKSRCSLPA